LRVSDFTTLNLASIRKRREEEDEDDAAATAATTRSASSSMHIIMKSHQSHSRLRPVA